MGEALFLLAPGPGNRQERGTPQDAPRSALMFPALQTCGGFAGLRTQAQERGQLGCRGSWRAGPLALPQALLPFVLLQAAERDNQNLEDKVRSLKTDIEESKYRQRHLKVELKSFLDVLDGKIDDLHDLRRGLSKLGADN